MVEDGKPLKWTYVNGFGEQDKSNVTDQDILSSIRFDKTGDYLSVGDRGGRIIVFKRLIHKKRPHLIDYGYFTEFQSHEQEFDVLKSMDIDEKINQIEWVNMGGRGLQLLTTNDKTVKLWKIYNKEEPKYYHFNIDERKPGKEIGHLRVPKVKKGQKMINQKVIRTFGKAHEHHINSLSLSMDNENFLSADDLRVNIWNIETATDVFCFVDIPAANLEELSEVITAAKFHPVNPALFAFSSSKGVIKLCDLRKNSSYEDSAQTYEIVEDPGKKNFFSEIINSVSDIMFLKNANFILSRDYLTTKVWDMRKTNMPVSTHRVTSYLEKRLCDLYESENIFDKFEIVGSPDSKFFVTGSYSNQFHVIDRFGTCNVTLEASFGNKRNAATGSYWYYADKQTAAPPNLNFNQKVSQHTWHPFTNTVAVANHNCLFIYNGNPQP